MNEKQKAELNNLFNGITGCGTLDYVCCWYKKSADYMQGTNIETAFVSTNSITQGEQMPILWRNLFNMGIRINFAHQTFKWSNEHAREQSMATVYCVIIGFAFFEKPKKRLYSYADVNGEPVEVYAKQINPYLLDAPTVFIESRNEPLCAVPPMSFGNMPLDGGNLIFSDEEKDAFLRLEPAALKYMHPLVSAKEMLTGKKRWCLWFVNAEPAELTKMPLVLKRIDAVKAFRLSSKAASTRLHAKTPALFRDKHNTVSFIAVPRVSSSDRDYVPMGFFDHNHISSDSCLIVPNGGLYEFGIMESRMNMAWMRTVCGYLGNGYRYSKNIVYNNFVWPIPDEKQKTAIEKAAQAVLDARAHHPASSLSDLYNPLVMPADLVKAHKRLDRAVDHAYNRDFANDGERVAWLFELYQQKAGELFAQTQTTERKQ
jgi:hypothetical protein